LPLTIRVEPTGSIRRLADRRREAAIDHPDRQVPEQVRDARAGQTLKQLGRTWADARKGGDRGEKGI
jgi:hypothetical protein